MDKLQFRRNLPAIGAEREDGELKGALKAFPNRFSKDRGFLFLTLLFLFAASTLKASDPSMTCSHRERSLQPGEAVVLQIKSSIPLAQLRIKAFGREFFGFAEDAGLNWTGLLGIDLDAKPGLYEAKMQGIAQNGEILAAKIDLQIKSKQFATRNLTVDEKYVSPPADALKRIQAERERVDAIFASTTFEKLWQGPFLRPVPGVVISAFGKRSVYNGQPKSAHSGVDFRGAAGTPIQSPNSGVVVLAANLYYSGNTVILDHGYGLYSYFGHMSAFSVKEGDRVKTGDLIGKVGATGVATGPHLHWTVRLSRSRIDPLSLIFLVK